MKILQSICFLSVLLIALGCGCKKKACDTEDNNNENTDTNHTTQDEGVSGESMPLNNQMMAIHDRAMLRIDEAENIKYELEEKMASVSDMVSEKKEDIEKAIQQLNTATERMMEWMHTSHDQESNSDKVHTAMKNRIKDLKEIEKNIIESIEKAKNIISPKEKK